MQNTMRGALATTIVVASVMGVFCGLAKVPGSEPTPTGGDLPAVASVDGSPLGLSVRYVDEDGRFVTVEPRDFPR